MDCSAVKTAHNNAITIRDALFKQMRYKILNNNIHNNIPNIFNPDVKDNEYTKKIIHLLKNECSVTMLNYIFTNYYIADINNVIIEILVISTMMNHKHDNIHRFFNNYEHDEKINLMQNLSYVMIRMANNAMLNYCINYLMGYNLKLRVFNDDDYGYHDYEHPKRSKKCIALLHEHNAYIDYATSLRGTWIKAIIDYSLL